MIKTQTRHISDLTSFVLSQHPYKVPEVISLKVRTGCGHGEDLFARPGLKYEQTTLNSRSKSFAHQSVRPMCNH